MIQEADAPEGELYTLGLHWNRTRYQGTTRLENTARERCQAELPSDPLWLLKSIMCLFSSPWVKGRLHNVSVVPTITAEMNGL